jgi:hypothetical protein
MIALCASTNLRTAVSFHSANSLAAETLFTIIIAHEATEFHDFLAREKSINYSLNYIALFYFTFLSFFRIFFGMYMHENGNRFFRRHQLDLGDSSLANGLVGRVLERIFNFNFILSRILMLIFLV